MDHLRGELRLAFTLPPGGPRSYLSLSLSRVLADLGGSNGPYRSRIGMEAIMRARASGATTTAWRTQRVVTAVALLVATAAGRVHGGGQLLVTIGDVTPTSAVVWARSAGGEVVADLSTGTPGQRWRAEVRTNPERDDTAKVLVTALDPGTRYQYRFSNGIESLVGHFVTAPPPQERTPVRFLWSGDLGSAGHCRQSAGGYRIFRAMARRPPDFFVFVGDTIYADHRCRGAEMVPGADFEATTLGEFYAKHRYNREDPAGQELLRTTSVYAIWDDHEVRNNFAGRTEPLAPAGLRAFLDYWPILPPEAEPTRLYRRVRWGRLLELFILDTRQYRSWDCRPDGRGKTMLGDAQRRWLVESVAGSDAVWKIIVSSVPFAIPKACPCSDSWASCRVLGFRTGFATEREAILRALHERRVKNLVVLAADVHYADLIRLGPAIGLTFHEFTAGPLSASQHQPQRLDPSLRPTRLFAVGGLNNFGEIELVEDALTVRIRDEQGQIVASRTIHSQE